MRLVGLIGGTTWLSSRDYYQHLNRLVQEACGGVESARVLLWSFNFGEVQRNNLRDDQAANLALILDGCRKMEAAGAEAVAVCANTMHMFAPEIRAAVGIPLIHLVEACAEYAADHEIRKLLLLGTRYTMEGEFYAKPYLDRGIELVIPGDADRIEIHRTIYEEMAKEQFLESTREMYRRIIGEYRETGIDGVIMGCTEIPILLAGEALGVPQLDTAKIHSRAIVQIMLG